MNYLMKNLCVVLVGLFLFSSCKEDEPAKDEMKDAAGNIYKTVTIGNQVWMAENLNALYTNKSNSSVFKDDAKAAVFWHSDDNPATMPTYRLLYSFDAAKALLPKGWRIPTLYDFEKLLNELRSNYDNGGNAVTNALKIYDYPGSNAGDMVTIDKYFSLLLDEASTSYAYEYQVIWLFARDFPDDDIYRNSVYTYNVTRDFASSVRFVKDVE